MDSQYMRNLNQRARAKAVENCFDTLLRLFMPDLAVSITIRHADRAMQAESGANPGSVQSAPSTSGVCRDSHSAGPDESGTKPGSEQNNQPEFVFRPIKDRGRGPRLCRRYRDSNL